jgi:hypothetical protein
MLDIFGSCFPVCKYWLNFLDKHCVIHEIYFNLFQTLLCNFTEVNMGYLCLSFCNFIGIMFTQ